MNPFLESACAAPESALPSPAQTSSRSGATKSERRDLSADEVALSDDGSMHLSSTSVPVADDPATVDSTVSLLDEPGPNVSSIATDRLPSWLPEASPRRRTRAVLRRTRHFVFLAALTVGSVSLATSGAAYGLDVNTATEAQLEGIRGIGPKTASLIVKERQQRGQFSSFEDFAGRVRGIGPKRAEQLAAQGLTVGAVARVLPSRSVASTGSRAAGAVAPALSRMPPALIVNTPDASKGKGH
jgi:competence protein ComEA